jgi:hypothetical protein
MRLYTPSPEKLSSSQRRLRSRKRKLSSVHLKCPNEFEVESKEVELKLLEDQIMMADLSTMDVARRAWFKKQQKTDPITRSISFHIAILFSSLH